MYQCLLWFSKKTKNKTTHNVILRPLQLLVLFSPAWPQAGWPQGLRQRQRLWCWFPPILLSASLRDAPRGIFSPSLLTRVLSISWSFCSRPIKRLMECLPPLQFLSSAALLTPLRPAWEGEVLSGKRSVGCGLSGVLDGPNGDTGFLAGR